MDTQNEIKDIKEGQCCGHGGKHIGHCIAKAAILLLVLTLVFAAGIGIGKHAGGREGFGKNKGFGYNGAFGGCGLSRENNDYGFGMMKSGNREGRLGMMGRWFGNNNEKASSTEVVGSITKIDGNKITILNNGNAEQVVVSTADTQIMAKTGLAGLKDLKTGQSIDAVGINKDNQIEAKLIRIVN